MISSVRGSQQVRSNRVMTKPGGFDSVCELGQMDHRPQGFETKLVRRWRWGKKGPWLGRILLGCLEVREMGL